MDSFLGKMGEVERRVAAVRRQAGRSAEDDAAALVAPLGACLGALAELRRLGHDLRRRTGVAVRDQGKAERGHAALVRDVLWGATDGRLHLYERPEDLPVAQPPLDAPILLDGPEALRALRNLVRRASEAAAMPDERRDALVSAVAEVGTNALVHAREGVATVGAAREGGAVQVRVTDRGAGIPLEHLPRVLLEMGYSLAGSGGFGLKIVLRAVDRVHLCTGVTGTTLFLEQNRTPPAPPWASHDRLTA